MAEQQIKPSSLGVPFTATFEGAIRSSKRRKKTGSAEKHWTGFLIRRSGSWKYRAFNPRPTLRKQDDRADQQVSLFDSIFQYQDGRTLLNELFESIHMSVPHTHGHVRRPQDNIYVTVSIGVS